MKLLGNLLWFFFGGLMNALAWAFAGLCCCITIIGIPVGKQCFKLASLTLWPFGKDIIQTGGTFSFLINIVWIILFGWELALMNLIWGVIWCVTIVGIPFGLQFFKLARLSLFPFGAEIIDA